MKYLFVIAKYKDYRQKIFEEIISPRNKIYAEKHGYKYIVIDNQHTIPLIRDNPIWWKLFVINQLLVSQRLLDNDEIVALDADMVICDYDTVLTPKKSMTYAIDSGNSHCMGWYSFIINEWSRKFIRLLFDEDRFNLWKDKYTYHPHFKDYSSVWRIWAEQASFYGLAGIIRHSDISFWDMQNFGWHSEPTESTLPLYELFSNIDILSTNYNVTIWPSESDTTFFINKIDKVDDVKIRHFTGSSWEVAKSWIHN